MKITSPKSGSHACKRHKPGESGPAKMKSDVPQHAPDKPHVAPRQHTEAIYEPKIMTATPWVLTLGPWFANHWAKIFRTHYLLICNNPVSSNHNGHLADEKTEKWLAQGHTDRRGEGGNEIHTSKPKCAHLSPWLDHRLPAAGRPSCFVFQVPSTRPGPAAHSVCWASKWRGLRRAQAHPLIPRPISYCPR